MAAFIESGGDREEFRKRFAHAASEGFDPDADLERLGCANQTTMLATESLAIAERVRQALVKRHGGAEAALRFRAFDTICSATQERQDALYALLDGTIDLVIRLIQLSSLPMMGPLRKKLLAIVRAVED